VEQLTYTNHEGVPESENIADYFREVTLFRRHHLSLPLSQTARNGMQFWSQNISVNFVRVGAGVWWVWDLLI